MAEVAGTIFGVISLSIQLFDKLNTYTNSVKDARKKAEQVTRELDTLVNLLENLETFISKLDPTTSAALTKNSIQECARAIEVIRSRLGDVAPATSSGRFWVRSKDVIKQLTYPFKESDIKYWKDVLGSIQQSLQIALLASQTDQLTTLQAQFGQFSLKTNAGIQMILDQQQRTLSLDSRYITCQNQMRGINYPVNQRLYEPGQHLVGLHGQDYSAPTLLPVSAIQLDNEMEYLQNHQSRTQPNLSIWRKGLSTADYCTCRGIRQEKRLLQRPVLLSWDRQYRHDRRCPSWFPEVCALNLKFGFVLSYLMFGLKLRILVALSIGAGTFSLTPSLACSRIVSESSSSAFKIIASMTNFESSRGTLHKNSAELSRIFQKRLSSPHDRLENGQTLLHYFCSRISQMVWSIHPSELDEYRVSLNQLLRHMSYADASEIDDQGSTCVDLLLGATDPVDHRWKLLVTDLLQHELKISARCHSDVCFKSYGSWVGISFESFADPFFGAHDVATSAALLRSEEDFARAVQGVRTNHPFETKKMVKLYKMTTRMGWVSGCKRLLEAGYSYVPEEHRVELLCAIPDPLLFDAIESGNQDMVLFWLTVRANATAAHLPYIGDLETAFVHASETCHQDHIANILLAHLVKQRCQIHEMTEKWGIQPPCFMRSNGVLDVHAICAFSALEEQGCQISPSLRPSQLSVYSVKSLYREQPFVYQRSDDPVRTLQMLYDAGFHDIQGEIRHCDHNTYCSPLIFAITGYRRLNPSPGSAARFFKMVDWLLSKGASLAECWPGSKTTALHCISVKAGVLTRKRPLNNYCLNKIAATLQHHTFDDCKCSCSKYGCTGVTFFWKGLYGFDLRHMGDIRGLIRSEEGVGVETSKYQRKDRSELERIIRCVAAATKDKDHRWIVTEFIRLCIFSLLGIRHVCCNINNIEHRGEPVFERQPLPRYSLAKSQRVAEEDEGLKGVLEKMVLSLDAQHSTYTGDLQSFIDELLLPQTKFQLDNLEREDKAMFDTGRRALGVVMGG